MTPSDPLDTPGELHFLVVDDDQQSRLTVVEYLASMGHDKITQAKDGVEALQCFDSDPSINFIISDWDMPTLNGLSLLQQIKANKERGNIPFLIVTSPVSAEAEKIVLAAENLVDAYLIKPFRAQIFKEKVEKMLSVATLVPEKQAVVVDDDADAREMIIEYLKKMGFKDVVGIPDGKSALVYLLTKSDNVGIVVSDWEMPNMSGIELLKACKSEQTLADIPFLMITSQSSMERMKVMQAARANVDQYLLKPFTATIMKKRVEAILERNRSRFEVQILFGEGNEHLEKNRFQAAQKKYEEALKLDPTFDHAYVALGDMYTKMQGIDTAIPYFKKAIEAAPFSARNYLRLSAAYEAVDWMDKAVALMQSATQSVPFNADLHFQLAKLYRKKNMPEFAKQELEKAVEIQPGHQEARLLLSLIVSTMNSDTLKKKG